MLMRDPSKPDDCRGYLAFLYSEYFCAAHRADTLGGWSAVLEHDPPWVAYLPLSSALHAISCCHCAPPFNLICYAYIVTISTKLCQYPMDFPNKDCEFLIILTSWAKAKKLFRVLLQATCGILVKISR